MSYEIRDWQNRSRTRLTTPVPKARRREPAGPYLPQNELGS
jgi:hypothetical protein